MDDPLVELVVDSVLLVASFLIVNGLAWLCERYDSQEAHDHDTDR